MPLRNGQPTWIEALHAAAHRKGVALPAPVSYAMGSVGWYSAKARRKVTLRRSLRRGDGPGASSVTWGFWTSDGDVQPVALIAEAGPPNEDRADYYLSLFTKWLIDLESPDALRQAVSPEAGTTNPYSEPHANGSIVWIGPEQELGVELRKDAWRLLSGCHILSEHRRSDGAVSQWLPIESLKKIRDWLQDNWHPLAFGTDVRPAIIRSASTSACRAFEVAQLLRSQEGSHEMADWWQRHAMRAADPLIPNLFIERQADDVVFSWNSLPANGTSYHIGEGLQIVSARFAIPALRELLDKSAATERGADRAAAHGSSRAREALAILREYHCSEPLSRRWLASVGFTKSQLAEFAMTGSSRHPIVGLLRSSRDSQITLPDVQELLHRLTEADKSSFDELRALTEGLDAGIDPREPWISGYNLAASVSARLGIAGTQAVDVDEILRRLSVTILEMTFDDVTIRGACIGTPGFQPTVAINSRSPDASGLSGRRTTLAHELCHLLFDRSRMRGLAKFEGPAGDADRLVEMRANAFAIELLVPMKQLIDENGHILPEEEIRILSEHRHVSMHALTWHAENLRRLQSS